MSADASAIAVGFYDPLHGSRLRLTDAADQAVLPVEVTVTAR